MDENEPDRPVILVADDSRVVTELFRRLLQQSGADVITAANGTEAIDLGLNQKIDLAIIDHVMPGRTGAEVLQAWRQAGMLAPVIMVSGMEDRRTRDEALTLGASAYLYKPVSSEELVAEIQRLLPAYRLLA